MPHLSPRDRELVALGAAMGSNCVPCIEYHIPQARKAGLSDSEISEAIRLSDKVRQVPARKVLDVALQMVTASPAPSDVVQSATVEAAKTVAAENAAVTQAQAGRDKSLAAAGSTSSDKPCCS